MPRDTAAVHRRAAEIFDQAVDLPEERRQSFLDSACGADTELRKRVAALLAAEKRAPSGFLAQTAAQMTVNQIVEESASLAGSRLGPYVVGKAIGAGGMGTVYEAHDTRLDRKVALKILPPAFTGDPERVSRFRQEARAVSLLNHPNIVSIFDAELDSDRYFIATELVEGESLGQMAARGPLEPKRLLEIAVQICSALEAAHEAGIVHRDIKPDNVMVRPDGIVKVLDFGLAKLLEPAQRPVSDLRTRPGSIAGTVQYLSPEQVLGETVGPRSDIFSAGVVLYELAAGMRPFDGPTDGAIFTNIVNKPPVRPLEAGKAIDPELEAIILRALEKDPDLRFQTAADLRAALKRLLRNSTASMERLAPEIARSAARSQRLPMAVIGWAAVAILVGAVGWWIGAASKRPPMLPLHFQRITDAPGEESFPCLLPDGKQFIYASSARGKWDIYLQRTGGEKAINLTAESPADDTEPSLSADGRKIAFRSEREGGGLFVMEATGENPRRISQQGYLPAWAPDGKSIVYADNDFVVPSSRRGAASRLHILDLASGRQRQLATEDAIQPNWSPHGYRIAFWGLSADAGMERDIFTVGTDSGGIVQVTKDPALDWNPVWSPSGDYLYFLSDRGGAMNLWRVRIDERSGKTRGEPEPVTTPAEAMAYLSFSADGRTFAYAEAWQRNNLFSVGYDAARQVITGEPVLVGSSAHNVTVFSLSPDDRRLVYDAVGDVQEDLWVMNSDGSGRRRLTDDPFKDRSPAWSPKGDEIVFMSDRSGQTDEWIIRPDGSGLMRLTAAPEPMQRPVWTADGKQVLASRVPGVASLVDPRPASPATNPPPLAGLANFSGAIFSPFPEHGGPVAGEWVGEKGWELILYDLAKGVVTRPGVLGRRPAYMPGDRQVIFGRGSKCLLYDLETHREKELFSVGTNTIYEIHSTHDGRRIFYTETIRDTDLWLGRMGK